MMYSEKDIIKNFNKNPAFTIAVLAESDPEGMLNLLKKSDEKYFLAMRENLTNLLNNKKYEEFGNLLVNDAHNGVLTNLTIKMGDLLLKKDSSLGNFASKNNPDLANQKSSAGGFFGDVGSAIGGFIGGIISPIVGSVSPVIQSVVPKSEKVEKKGGDTKNNTMWWILGISAAAIIIIMLIFLKVKK